MWPIGGFDLVLVIDPFGKEGMSPGFSKGMTNFGGFPFKGVYIRVEWADFFQAFMGPCPFAIVNIPSSVIQESSTCDQPLSSGGPGGWPVRWTSE